MKNRDPRSGLKQITSGKLYLPRRLILELIRSKKITVNELGYYILLTIAADWTNNEYRYGHIRHEIKNLAKIYNVSYSTLNENLNKLTDKGLVTKKEKIPIIVDYEHFEKSSGIYSNKNTTTNEELESLFGKSLFKYENSDSHQIGENNSHKIPYKVEYISNSIPVTEKAVRTIADYQQIFQENDYRLLDSEEMEWLDNHIDHQGKTTL
ncbi:hypothetical protein KKI22_00705 [Patescibacteria group bacterium]|nr:hypothetical protein [Patescibacteria group bacterium]